MKLGDKGDELLLTQYCPCDEIEEKMRWEGQVARMGKEEACTGVVMVGLRSDMDFGLKLKTE